jgi:uncharacterized membrane protein
MNRAAMWLCLLAGILWIMVGVRDTFAPGFFTMGPRIVTKLDITMNFAAAAIFLIAAAAFRMSKPRVQSK